MNEFAAQAQRDHEAIVAALEDQLAEVRFEVQVLEDENARLRAAILFIDGQLDTLMKRIQGATQV